MLIAVFLSSDGMIVKRSFRDESVSEYLTEVKKLFKYCLLTKTGCRGCAGGTKCAKKNSKRNLNASVLFGRSAEVQEGTTKRYVR